MLTYPAQFEDDRGAHEAVLTNDGTDLTLVVRGVTFRGSDFDALEPDDVAEARAAGFVLSAHRELCACRLGFRIGVEHVDATMVVLDCELELGQPDERLAIDHESIRITARMGQQTAISPGTTGWFEDELNAIIAAIGPLRCCFGCAYSDYHPVGHGLFGSMGCFRHCKEAYLAVADKAELMHLWDDEVDTVQETHVCPEFAQRRPGSGYRG